VTQQQIEEIAELLWTLREEGIDREEEVVRRGPFAETADVLVEMGRLGLLIRKGDRVRLTEKGERQGKTIVRRYRLARRLLHDVFEVGEDAAHETACAFEHILSPEVTDTVCTFLGHPPVDPDGRAIPPGDCCRKFTVAIEPLVRPLRDLDPGEAGRIVFLLPGSPSRMSRLGNLGLLPGSRVRLVQKAPSYVIEIGETTLALEEAIAGEIFVKKTGA
jgi:DtxR family Mn-dependent transcriptional regulator